MTFGKREVALHLSFTVLKNWHEYCISPFCPENPNFSRSRVPTFFLWRNFLTFPVCLIFPPNFFPRLKNTNLMYLSIQMKLSNQVTKTLLFSQNWTKICTENTIFIPAIWNVSFIIWPDFPWPNQNFLDFLITFL